MMWERSSAKPQSNPRKEVFAWVTNTWSGGWFVFIFIYFLIEGKLLYRILLLSVKHQHESAIYISFNSSFCFSFPQTQREARVRRVTTSQMAKDLMSPDLWWSHHRNLNRASDSCYSNVLSSIQATIWTHTSSWLTRTIQQPARGPLSLPFTH